MEQTDLEQAYAEIGTLEFWGVSIFILVLIGFVLQKLISFVERIYFETSDYDVHTVCWGIIAPYMLFGLYALQFIFGFLLLTVLTMGSV